MDKMEKYSDVRLRKVAILGGRAREAAINAGAKDDDLVILKTLYSKGISPVYEVEIIQGDPVSFLMRKGELKGFGVVEDIEFSQDLQEYLTNSKDVVITESLRKWVMEISPEILLSVVKRIRNGIEILSVKIVDDHFIEEYFPSSKLSALQTSSVVFQKIRKILDGNVVPMQFKLEFIDQLLKEEGY
jgi:hypothetical protein